MAGFLPERGGYKKLIVFDIAQTIFDINAYFVAHYIRRGSRTVDQMEQAARSGKQNIAEGSMASMTSRETEIKLTNVARASFAELLEDYEDFLRINSLSQWTIENPRLSRLRHYVRTPQFKDGYMQLLPRLSAEEIANLMLTLINQAMSMLSKMLTSQQDQFLAEGGIREQMTRERLRVRSTHK